ncbi:hypothetical protein [Roseomonas gilardii]|uniref:hypothetical protein n=1 Tax=Roseomonas gilardii TaxID=257708 RepID=UPI0012EBFAF3|nr:hypothetical protein [Roseomonas gilardii]
MTKPQRSAPKRKARKAVSGPPFVNIASDEKFIYAETHINFNASHVAKLVKFVDIKKGPYSVPAATMAWMLQGAMRQSFYAWYSWQIHLLPEKKAWLLGFSRKLSAVLAMISPEWRDPSRQETSEHGQMIAAQLLLEPEVDDLLINLHLQIQEHAQQIAGVRRPKGRPLPPARDNEMYDEEVLHGAITFLKYLSVSADLAYRHHKQNSRPGRVGQEALSRFVDEILRIYEFCFEREPGVSRDANTGKISGPAVRYCTFLFAHLGACLRKMPDGPHEKFAKIIERVAASPHAVSERIRGARARSHMGKNKRKKG